MFVNDVKPYTWIWIETGDVCFVLAIDKSTLLLISQRNAGFRTWYLNPNEEVYPHDPALYECYNALKIVFEDREWLKKEGI
jgi:hypothetical protein